LNITIHYEPSLDLLLTGYEEHRKKLKIKTIEKVVGWVLVIAGLLSSSMLLLSVLMGWSEVRWWYYFVLLMPVMGVVEIKGFLDIGRIVLKSRFKQEKKFRSSQHVNFTEERLHYWTEDINSELKWDIYQEYLVGDDVLMLFMSKRSYSAFPRWAFAAEDWEQLLDFLQKRFGKAQARRSAP
jgi:hypothetical protein